MVLSPIHNLSLASGGAGLDLGLELALPIVRTICYVECEAFAAEFLASRMEAKALAKAPIWSNLKTFDGRPWRGVVDSITAGYPCQPFSNAGHRRGKNDPRHLWPSIHRIAGEIMPQFLFMENVSGHLNLGFDEVAGGLEKLGFKVAAGLFTASEVGLPHERERLFILALGESLCQSWKGRNTQSDQRSTKPIGKMVEELEYSGSKGSPRKEWFEASATKEKGKGSPGSASKPSRFLFPPTPSNIEQWEKIAIEEPLRFPIEPKIRGLVDGLATDYLRLAGNGVVPVQAAYAFLSLWSTATGTLKDDQRK